MPAQVFRLRRAEGYDLCIGDAQSLSFLEEAYQLARAGKQAKPTEQAKPKTEEAKPKTEATGPTKATPRPKGEKRGITQASTLKSPKSVREAAQQAIQEVLGS